MKGETLMNYLVEKVIMRIEREVGPTGKFVFLKQCADLNIDLDKFEPHDIERVIDRLILALTYFIGETPAKTLINNIRATINEYKIKMNRGVIS